MAEIIPFKAVRPPRDKVHLVATRNYVTYPPRQLNRILSENPFTFIHILNPEYGMTRKSRANSTLRFQRIKKKFDEFFDEGIFIQDSEENFYIYRQTTPTHRFTGIICGVAVKDYNEGHIKIHEHTLTPRVEVFTRYLDICDFNAEPVLLTYTDIRPDIDKLINKNSEERPEYDFTTRDRKRHQLWVISDKTAIKAIKEAFGTIDCLYIADGHHRMASSAKLNEKRKQERKSNAPSIDDYALALLMPDRKLNIRPFHRVVELGEQLDEKKFIKDLEKHYEVSKTTEQYFPKEARNFGLRLASGWYALKLKDEVTSNDVVEHLDPMILTRTILEPIFHITDQKIDKRISFIPGKDPLDKYEKGIDEGTVTALFTLYSTSTKQLCAVSDAGEVMPPKSTYVEPKLRSGLTVMRLS